MFLYNFHKNGTIASWKIISIDHYQRINQYILRSHEWNCNSLEVCYKVVFSSKERKKIQSFISLSHLHNNILNYQNLFLYCSNPLVICYQRKKYIHKSIQNTVFMRTSKYHIDFIHNEWSAALGMAEAPGKNYQWSFQRRSLPVDIQTIKQNEIKLVVSLLEEDEMKWLGIPQQIPDIQKSGLQVEHYPIEDMDVPDDPKKFKDLVRKVVKDYLEKGKKVLVHCQGGNGRSGLFVAACFMFKGDSPEQSIQKVRKVRRFAIQSRRQQKFLRQLSFQ